MLALTFIFAVVSVISFLIVSSITSFNTKVMIDPASVRGFKGTQLSTNISLIFKRSRWIGVYLSSVTGPPGLDIKSKFSEGDLKVFMSSKYSGHYSGLTLKFEIRDILNLFSKEIETVYADFSFDSLPLSLLVPIPSSKPTPLAMGDKSGKSPGSSLELYALDEYQPFTETKNVMWKRIARMPDERLIVRIRDSSIPRIIRIGFVQSNYRVGEDRLEWMDLSCEAIGMLASGLLTARCFIELMHTSENSFDPVVVHEISNVDELIAALMKLSDPPKAGRDMENALKIIDRCDIVVCGMRELENEMIAFPIARKPTLAIHEERPSPLVANQATLVYTGVEDVHKLMLKVLER